MSGPRRPIGFIADDITGATDLASALSGRGLDTRLVFSSGTAPEGDPDAVVVALKVRSVPASDARGAVIDAANTLRAVGVEQFFFKYCSTFDSTAEGNIGPIADALIDVTRAPRVVHCPAYPANGRTVYRGHLFVGDELLSESPMRNHPLNPMRDAQLLRVLGEQTSRRVTLLNLPAVDAGADTVVRRLGEIADGPHVIADAVRDRDLDTIAHATAADLLAAGSAAFGAAFAAAALAHIGDSANRNGARAIPPSGPAAILAGSLSRATREQVCTFDGPTLTLGIGELVDGAIAVHRAVEFAGARQSDGAVLIATDPDAVAAPSDVAHRIEMAMGQIGLALERRGVRRLVVAGGETSGAVAHALDLRSARIGPDISVGVPWIVADDRELAIAFKSGNFGGPSFFRDALKVAGA